MASSCFCLRHSHSWAIPRRDYIYLFCKKINTIYGVFETRVGITLKELFNKVQI